MNCYHCATRQVAAAAVAICLQCGVAVCQTHAYERYLPAVPVGMAGAGSPARRALVCQTCFQGYSEKDATPRSTQILPDPKASNLPTFLTYSTHSTPEQKNSPRIKYAHSAYEPLDEQAAIEIADALVRSQPVRFAPRTNWQQKVSSLFHTILKPRRR